MLLLEICIYFANWLIEETYYIYFFIRKFISCDLLLCYIVFIVYNQIFLYHVVLDFRERRK